MDRRSFLLTAAAGLTLPAVPVLAGGGVAYTRGLVDEKLAAGETVFIDYYTDWCTTCRAQQSALRALKQANPAYEEAISFVSVNWDDHGNGPLANRLNIPRRSTLVVLKGNQELGRLVAATSRSKIQGLLDTALSAAVA